MPYPLPDYVAEILPVDDQAPRTHWQEWFSWSFVSAVVSAAGLVPSLIQPDVNQMDVMVQTYGPYEGKIRTVGLQLKSTYAPSFVEEDAYVAHDLSADRYNQLLAPSDIQRFLVIIAVPRPPAATVALESDVAHVQAAAWWGRVEGEREEVQQTRRVKLPTNQRFDAEGLKAMLLTT